MSKDFQLFKACIDGNKARAGELINAGANVNACFGPILTPLQVASERGHTELVKLLLKHNANVDDVNEFGHSALILASEHGHTEVVKLLLTHNADINLRNQRGDTALIEAARNGHTETVHTLLNGGANINDISDFIKQHNIHKSIINDLLNEGTSRAEVSDFIKQHRYEPDNPKQPIMEKFLNHKERLQEVADFLFSFALRDENDNILSNIDVYRLNDDQKALLEDARRFNKDNISDAIADKLAENGRLIKPVKEIANSVMNATIDKAEPQLIAQNTLRQQVMLRRELPMDITSNIASYLTKNDANALNIANANHYYVRNKTNSKGPAR